MFAFSLPLVNVRGSAFLFSQPHSLHQSLGSGLHFSSQQSPETTLAKEEGGARLASRFLPLAAKHEHLSCHTLCWAQGKWWQTKQADFAIMEVGSLAEETVSEPTYMHVKLPT